MPQACSNISQHAFHPDYAAISSITTLDSRLRDEAYQIVVSRRVYGMVEEWTEGVSLDKPTLKGSIVPAIPKGAATFGFLAAPRRFFRTCVCAGTDAWYRWVGTHRTLT